MTLLIGPSVPVPAPYVVIEALTSVEVRTETGKPGTFQLQFQVGKRSRLDETFMLSGLSAVPILRVIIIVTVNGLPNVLMDGVVANTQYTPSMQGLSQLTVTGEDLTKLMDLQELDGFPYPAMPSFSRVSAILAKYATFGITSQVVPNKASTPSPADRFPSHRGTDLKYIKLLAGHAGFEFYHAPSPVPGISVAYWGPAIKIGLPQPALTMNSDARNNIETLNFNMESNERVLPVSMIQEPTTKATIPILAPSINALNPPLGLVVPPPTKVRILNKSAKKTFSEAQESALALASGSADVVTANGSLDVLRYGRVLQPRKLVGVRGAGTAFDGEYYVESVTHKIKRGEYKQDFRLSRNALVSLTNRVRV